MSATRFLFQRFFKHAVIHDDGRGLLPFLSILRASPARIKEMPCHETRAVKQEKHDSDSVPMMRAFARKVCVRHRLVLPLNHIHRSAV